MTGLTAKPQGLSPLAAAGIVAAVLGVSAIVGRRNAPDRSHPRTRLWYKRLDKPNYTPPDPAFGAVWPTLEVGLAVGGYRLLRRLPSRPKNVAIALWLVNNGMVGGWTQLFFRRHALGASALASGAMLAGGTVYVVATSRVDRVAQATAIPFVAWLGFATLLAEEVWRRNPSSQRLPGA